MRAQYRPYFACGRRQLRIGWSWLEGHPDGIRIQKYRWIGLTWQ